MVFIYSLYILEYRIRARINRHVAVIVNVVAFVGCANTVGGGTFILYPLAMDPSPAVNDGRFTGVDEWVQFPVRGYITHIALGESMELRDDRYWTINFVQCRRLVVIEKVFGI